MVRDRVADEEVAAADEEVAAADEEVGAEDEEVGAADEEVGATAEDDIRVVANHDIRDDIRATTDEGARQNRVKKRIQR